MRKRLFLLLLAPSFLQGCGFIVVRTARKVYKESTKDESAVEQALAGYREAVLHADAAKAAAFFSDDAQLSHGSEAPVLGRPAILAFLKQFEGWRVEEYEIAASSTDVDGDQATQKGSYRQKVVTPKGEPVEAKGVFEAKWSRQGGRWLLMRMHTASNPPAGKS